MVINAFPPAWQAGGPVRVAYELSKELVKRKHKVVVYTTNMYSKTSESIYKENRTIMEGIMVYRFKNLSDMLARMNMPMAIGMASSLKENMKEFDVIHAHLYRCLQAALTHHYAKKYAVPYVLQVHGSLPRIGSWRKLKRIFDVFFGYRLLRDASKVIALNGFEAEQYRAMGVPDRKIAIIPNGIDLSEYSNLPPKGSFKSKYNIPGDKKIILYLGRIHRTKGIELLIKAYAYLVEKMNCKDVVLVIAGPDDGYLNEAKVLASSLNVLSSILFTGFISKEDKFKALVDAEVFVTPSFYGFPVTFLEACATGTPIVTTNLGDMLEWIDSIVGYVTQPTPYDIAEAIYNIISNEELHRRFSENCVSIVKSSFSIENIVSKLEKVYEEIVGSPWLR